MRYMHHQNNDYTEGPLLWRILIFTFPLMLSNMLQLLYNAADVMVVGQFGTTQSLAAVGSTGSLTGLIVNLFLGLATGVSVMVAQQLGARKAKDVSDTAHTAVLISLIGGVVISVVGVLFARQWLEWMGSPDDVIDLAALYMRIYFIGMPANMLYNFGSAILRASGDTKRPLMYLSISGLINVLLNLLLVIVFHMDVAGVAIATVAAQVISAILVLLALMHSEECYRIDLRQLRIYKSKLIQMIRLGLPAGLQSSLFAISNILIQSSINSFGAAAMAGNTAGSNIDAFIYTAGNSVYHAGVTFTGQNVGAKKYHRIRRITWICVSVVLVICLTITGLVYLLRTPLLSIYTSDPEVLYYANIRLNIMGTTYFLAALMDLMCGQLRAMGKSLVPMIVSVFGACGLRIVWIYTVFAFWFHSMESLYISYPITWFITGAVHFICYLVVKRNLIRKNEQNSEETQV